MKTIIRFVTFNHIVVTKYFTANIVILQSLYVIVNVLLILLLNIVNIFSESKNIKSFNVWYFVCLYFKDDNTLIEKQMYIIINIHTYVCTAAY